ncbi:MAG TPA: L,D-transpeptidase family protein [Candidatus Binatia bacterium]|nr:L,D-transpeptidase family protein [Candidatus Binatia bacterium]
MPAALRAGLGLALVGLAACRGPQPAPDRDLAARNYTEALFAQKAIPVYTLATRADGTPSDTVIGEPRTYRIRDGDTLMDVARYDDLGYNEIVAANPGVDPWVPPVGATIVLPTAWVLPCCTYTGIVLNIPEMRLFYYERPAGRSHTLVVRTYPVGLGRRDRRTPRGRFRVRGKTVNPRWVIPESIRAEHIRERGDARTTIAGGAPDNPLGKYRLELTIPRYAIHGTDIPWGVGMEVSHGCARLYPEDIERLFPIVPVGTPVEFTYQRAKLGTRAGATFVQVGADIYGYGPTQPRQLLTAPGPRWPRGAVDMRRLAAAFREARDVPVDVTSARR